MSLKISEFSITEKHYETIVKQGHDNLPYETGGFLGGRSDGLVTAILPIYNKHDDGKTDNFVFNSYDLESAHKFFKKHEVFYFGMYHTHPTGVAYPSPEDIQSGQRFHFIICYENPKAPILNVFEIIANQPHQIPLKIVSNKGFRSKEKGEETALKKRFSPQQNPVQDREDLEERIGNMILEQPNQYKKIEPRSDVDGSDFSTMA